MFVFSVHFNQSLSSVAFLFIYLAVSGLSCGAQVLRCREDLSVPTRE